MIEVHVITALTDPRCVAVPALVQAMYTEEAALGSPMMLAAQGGETWLKGMGATLERFGRLVVATDQASTVIGFAHGAIRLPPGHLAGGPVATITHVYVEPLHRRGGVAGAMVRSLADWFTLRNVDRTELTVVAGNGAAIAFWGSLGFSPMLLQMARH